MSKGRRKHWSTTEALRFQRHRQLGRLVDVRPETARRIDRLALELEALRRGIQRRRGPMVVSAITDLLLAAESSLVQARGAMVPSLVDDGNLP